MRIRRWIEGDLARIPDPRSAVTEHLAASSTSFTITDDDDQPLMIIGFVKLWEGCAQVWAIPSDSVRGKGLWLVRLARNMLKICARDYNLHRYHTLMDPMDTESLKWIRLLGFHHEATFKKAYADGRELLVYARFFTGEDDGRR